MKHMVWFAVFFAGLCVYAVPDWHNRHTITGAFIGLAFSVLMAAYSYHVQWRKRLTKKQLQRGMRQSRTFQAALALPCAGLGILAATMLSGNELEPYAKGAFCVFLSLVAVFAVVNMYAKKGLFQQPLTGPSKHPTKKS